MNFVVVVGSFFYRNCFLRKNENTLEKARQKLQKILFLLSSKGLLIFERQALDALMPNMFKPKLETLEKCFIIREKRTVHSEYPVNVSERIFLILEKK